MALISRVKYHHIKDYTSEMPRQDKHNTAHMRHNYENVQLLDKRVNSTPFSWSKKRKKKKKKKSAQTLIRPPTEK